ncbi:hypothetical protein EPUS_09259 [Endocarpon pusillum Z07020]|uniref:Geranylgeranyl pyrophosphate synthetase n=1 Tax=Endocarpon pusillum (strain Z07020 / HMAS-L-300199) TaxID=1263415 RepID=U1HTU3_ENDPU|nr:uncharacterized protein EPUS_09259 [Endocarpon pusillum Z07020]ERF72669.1 hypothetical protein EPUS_09259 [Endocarpon pusillum Z07020]
MSNPDNSLQLLAPCRAEIQGDGWLAALHVKCAAKSLSKHISRTDLILSSPLRHGEQYLNCLHLQLSFEASTPTAKCLLIVVHTEVSIRFEEEDPGRGATNPSRARPPQTLPPPKPLGPTIDRIDIKTLSTEEDAPKIKDVEYVASYNWTSGKSPVILVPGSPPAWTPPVTDTQLKRDSEDVFRDINAARYASYPLEPTFRSIPFRFDVDVVGDTVLFVRKESSLTEVITNLQGYGHTFPEAYTTWDSEVAGSCSHQRIIHYEFGGLKFLVRTETDGYVKEAGEKASSSVEKSTSQPSLDDAFGTMTVTSTEVRQGQQLQLKTQGTRTARFLIAYHQFGLFDKPKVKDISQEVIQWEKDNSTLLARFHALIDRIVKVVRDCDQQQCEVSWDGQGPLCVTKQIGEVRRALPPDLLHVLEAP